MLLPKRPAPIICMESQEMNDTTIPQQLTNERITQRVEMNGMSIFKVATPEERRPLYEYGRFLQARMEPTTGCTLRFYGALRTLAPRLPDYQALIDETALYPEVLSRFQSRLAVYIARNDFEVMVQR